MRHVNHVYIRLFWSAHHLGVRTKQETSVPRWCATAHHGREKPRGGEQQREVYVMKKLFSALVATMFLVLFLTATAMAAPNMKLATADATLGEVEDIVNHHLQGVAERFEDLQKQLNRKANNGQVATTADLNAVKDAILDRKAAEGVLKRRLNILKAGVQANRADIESLIKEAKDLRGLSAAQATRLNKLATEMLEVQADVKGHTEDIKGLQDRAKGIETRQNKTDANVARVEDKVDAVVASQWRSELQLGIETGRDIATASTNAVVGIGSKLPSGYGWWTAFSLGLGDVLAAPHPTSAAFRAGVTSTIGGSNSPLSAQFGLLAGMAAKTSLALDAGIAVGATVGLTYKPRGWPVGFTASAGQVFGRFEGFIVHAGLYFDPLALGDLGK